MLRRLLLICCILAVLLTTSISSSTPNNSAIAPPAAVASSSNPPNKFVGVVYETYMDVISNCFNGVRPGPGEGRYVYPTLVPVGKGGWMWWGRPAIRGGVTTHFYNSSNTGVINTHADELVAAGVDFILIDYTNHNIRARNMHNPTLTLLNVYQDRMSRGVATPKVAFFTSSGYYNNGVTIDNNCGDMTYPAPDASGGNELQELYNQIYAPGRYNSNLFFKYGAKPLLMTFPYEPSSDPKLNQPGCSGRTINGQPATNFFECRRSEGAQLSFPTPVWTFSDYFPQSSYTRAAWAAPASNAQEWSEQTSVSPAQGYFGMSNPESHAGNFVHALCTGTQNANVGYVGQNFTEQWTDRVRNINPTIVVAFAWNKWTAIRFEATQTYNASQPPCPAQPPPASRTTQQLYIDDYSPNFTNDIEPEYSGDPGSHGDTYYQILKQRIAAYKKNSPDLFLRDTTTGRWYLKEGRGGQQWAANNYTHVFDWVAGSHYQPYTGDFNGDGRTDIGMRDSSIGRWFFLYQDVNGNYGGQTSYDWTAGSHFQVIVGDFGYDNGSTRTATSDGWTDIGLRDTNTGAVYVRFNQRNNSYGWERNYINWVAGSHYQVLTGDFNADGRGDFGLRDSSIGRWFFLYQDTNRNLGGQTSFDWAVGSHFHAFTGDFDCDSSRRTDIALRNTSTGDIHLANYVAAPSSYGNSDNYKWRSGTSYQIINDVPRCSP